MIQKSNSTQFRQVFIEVEMAQMLPFDVEITMMNIPFELNVSITIWKGAIKKLKKKRNIVVGRVFLLTHV